jgi:hypothetical protein
LVRNIQISTETDETDFESAASASSASPALFELVL